MLTCTRRPLFVWQPPFFVCVLLTIIVGGVGVADLDVRTRRGGANSVVLDVSYPRRTSRFHATANSSRRPRIIDGERLPGDDSLIFESVSESDAVVLFGKGCPTIDYIQTHLSHAPRCIANGQKWRNLSTVAKETFKCVFNAGNLVPLVRTAALSVTQQVYRCEHPPATLRTRLAGSAVTFEVHGFQMHSTAVYTLPPVQNKPSSRGKPHFLCGCTLMWHRSEFLLEWTRWHFAVHGMSKLFLYDNGSEIDDLEAEATVIGSSYNIERKYWPEYPTQTAFAGHCLLRAKRECVWVAFFDVDEYAFGHGYDGRLDSYLARKRTEIPRLGGIELRMLAMSRNSTNLTTAAEVRSTGVIRTYGCRWKGMNVKSVLRPEAVVRSLWTGVHTFCYRPGWKRIQLQSDANFVLFHFKYPVWEVYMRRYSRRASAGSTSAYHTGHLSMSRPTNKWFKESVRCKVDDPSLTERMLCGSSFKLLRSGAGCGVRDIRQALFIGVPGPGLDLFGLNLHSSFLPVYKSLSIRDNRTQVKVDWSFSIRRAPARSESPMAPRSHRYRRVTLVVSEPLAAISAAVDFPQAHWEHIQAVLGDQHVVFPKAATGNITHALRFWVVWNRLAGFTADTIIRAEHPDWISLCNDIFQHEKCSDLKSKPTETSPYLGAPNLTWQILQETDPVGTRIAKRLASNYGYSVSDFPSAPFR